MNAILLSDRNQQKEEKNSIKSLVEIIIVRCFTIKNKKKEM